ncbi:universal stress protein [Egbenema bharatensis]|uniref:universal stress protein n=1 Tax=Egbenema bharatensis TaxID=3463334 RepID=UPI003A8B0059
MFERILVAIDTSTGDRHVFDTALSLAQLTQARLLLAHVLSDLDTMNDSDTRRRGDAEGNPHYDEMPRLANAPAHHANGLEMLRQFHAIAKASGIGADIAQPLANPGDKICNLAIDWGADLIVMGRREPEDLQTSTQSSVSDYVVCSTSCPVLVIQHQKCDRASGYRNQVAIMH